MCKECAVSTLKSLGSNGCSRIPSDFISLVNRAKPCARRWILNEEKKKKMKETSNGYNAFLMKLRAKARDYRDIFENVENLKLEIRKYIISDWDKILDQKVLEKIFEFAKIIEANLFFQFKFIPNQDSKRC